MNLLHIDSSILGTRSVTRKLSADIVKKLQSPESVVTYRDLAAQPIAHLHGNTFSAMQNPQGEYPAEVQADLAIGNAVLEEFKAADTVVIGVAFYNFSIPSLLKVWIDRILVAGHTFKYSDGRVEGLAGSKRVILAIARGGYYGAESPMASFEHAESYLRAVFAFMGVKDISVISAEGMAVGPEPRQAGLTAAELQIAKLAA